MSTWNKLIFSTLFFVISGCSSDYGMTKKRIEADPGVTAPEIEVDPTYHDYGALSAGSETQEVIINIENIGNGDLDISDIYLHNGGNFATYKKPWTTPIAMSGSNPKFPCITSTYVRQVAEGSNKVTFNTCTGFRNKEICACPTMFVAVGAATGYMGILSTVLTSVYVFLAGWFDPVAPADDEEVAVEAKGNPDAVIIRLDEPEGVGLGDVGVVAGGADVGVADADTK